MGTTDRDGHANVVDASCESELGPLGEGRSWAWWWLGGLVAMAIWMSGPAVWMDGLVVVVVRGLVV